MQEIIRLPSVQGTQPARIHAFLEKILASVLSLETLGKLTDGSGYVRMTLDKLEGMQSELFERMTAGRNIRANSLLKLILRNLRRNFTC